MSASKAADTTRDDVDHLADIAIFADETGGTLDIDIPLGDTLPAAPTPRPLPGWHPTYLPRPPIA